MASQYPFRGDTLISGHDLKGGQIAYLHGKVNYAILAKQLSGQALADYNTRQKQVRMQYSRNGSYTPVAENSLIIALSDVDLVPNANGDNTQLEQYIKDHIFTSDKHPELGHQYNRAVITNIMPVLLKKEAQITDTDGNVKEHAYRILDRLDQEPANGTDVTVVFNTYSSKSSGNSGMGVKYILFNDEGPLSYYTPGINRNDFKDLGIDIAGPVSDPRAGQDAGRGGAPESEPEPDPDQNQALDDMLR